WNVANEKQAVPMEALSGLLARRLEERVAEDLLTVTFEEVQKRLKEFAEKRDNKGAEAYLAKAAKDFGLQTGKMTEGRDRYSIPDDKNIKPLRDAYLRLPAFYRQILQLPVEDPKLKSFYVFFFGESRLHEPHPFPGDTSAHSLLYWKIEDVPARTLRLSDAGMREKVESAWRLLKGREMARKKADEVAVEVQKTNGDVQKLRDVGARLKRE